MQGCNSIIQPSSAIFPVFSRTTEPRVSPPPIYRKTSGRTDAFLRWRAVERSGILLLVFLSLPLTAQRSAWLITMEFIDHSQLWASSYEGTFWNAYCLFGPIVWNNLSPYYSLFDVARGFLLATMEKFQYHEACTPLPPLLTRVLAPRHLYLPLLFAAFYPHSFFTRSTLSKQDWHPKCLSLIHTVSFELVLSVFWYDKHAW